MRHHFLYYKSIGVWFRCSMAVNSVVCGPIWPKFEHILDIMHVLVTYKAKMDRANSNRDKVDTSIFKMHKGSLLRSRSSDLDQIQTGPGFYECPCYLQVSRGSDHKQPRKSGDIVFPIIILWGLRAASSAVGGWIRRKLKLI